MAAATKEDVDKLMMEIKNLQNQMAGSIRQVRDEFTDMNTQTTMSITDVRERVYRSELKASRQLTTQERCLRRLLRTWQM